VRKFARRWCKNITWRLRRRPYLTRQTSDHPSSGDACPDASWRLTIMINHRVVLSERPAGIPQASHFRIEKAPLGELPEGELHVRNLYLSVDPAMRGWLSDTSNYSAPIAIGDVMRAFAVGEVVRSRHRDFIAGDRIMGWFGWQEHAYVRPEAVLMRVEEATLPLSLYLGVLGVTGLTAYFGLVDVCKPRDGDTIVVSTAAGSVGSCVGQIAKILGCRTVGIAGGPHKVKQCLDEFGYDAAIDYKTTPDLHHAIGDACPSGVDAYFDNTSGSISDAVLRHLRVGARVAVCGTASISAWEPWPAGPRPERHLLVKRATMRGFLLLDFVDRFSAGSSQLAAWVREGKLRYREHLLDGLEECPGAIARLYAGENTGKLVIRLSADG
jgi:NADPH-dependent curcumin reductase